jgi:hypothetical protein
MNFYEHLICGGTLDLNLRDRSIGKLFANNPADHEIFRQNSFVITLSIPTGLPSSYDAEPEPIGMHFMSQKCPPS